MFYLYFSTALRLKGVIPIMLKTSHIREVFMRLSIGEEELKEGETFTSKSQGLKLESSKISKP